MLWELLIVLAILFAFLWSAMVFLSVYVKYENVTYGAKSIARMVETTGCYKQEDLDRWLSELMGDIGVTDLKIECTAGPFPGEYSIDAETDSSFQTKHQLQLTQTFTLTVSCNYPVHLIGAKDGALLAEYDEITVPMTYTVKGMSEVYFRE